MNKVMEIIKSNDRKTREQIRQQLKDHFLDVPDLHEKGSRVMLSWDQIREMSENNMTIASHTMTHLNLPNATPDDANQEIIQSKELLEEMIQKEVNHFSYPNGGKYEYYNEKIKSFVKQAGYKTATTSNNGVTRIGDDALELNRLRVTPNLSEIIYQIHCEPVVQQIMKNN